MERSLPHTRADDNPVPLVSAKAKGKSGLDAARLDAAALSLAFTLTGVGTALLGAALPAMLAEGHLSDRNGGSLLFSAFAGSTFGAVFVQRAQRWPAAAGLAASGLAALLMAQLQGDFPLPVLLLYGAGLGTTMTAISLLQAKDASSATSHLALNRLNLFWALGAFAAPVLALHSLRAMSGLTLFRSEGIFFISVAVAVLFTTKRAVHGAENVSSQLQLPPCPAHVAPFRLCLFAAAAVGIESALGGWLTTYTERMVHGNALAISADSAFWLGLLVIRALHSLPGTAWLHSRFSLAAHLAAVLIATTLLVVSPHGFALVLGAGLAGVGLGPLYPFVLAMTLPFYRPGAIFVLAGVGSAVLPWLTGALSTAFGSLRAGLLVPCASVGLLLGTGLWMWQEIPETEAALT